MRISLPFAAFLTFATVLPAAPAMADDATLQYLLFVNTSTHPFKVSDMTLGGKACSACGDRTIAPGSATMVKIGPLGADHLKLTVTGSGTCKFDFASDGSSRTGDCGSSPTLKYVGDVHDEMLFHTEGTPAFTLIYAYDPH